MKATYEVVDYVSGGFFVHGGQLSDTYFKSKEDAALVCEALNLSVRLKKAAKVIHDAAVTLEELEQALKP